MMKTFAILLTLLSAGEALASSEVQFVAAPSMIMNSARGQAAADFDGDGILDLAAITASSSSRQIAILLGDGRGGFHQRSATVESSSSLFAIAAGDVNGDGFADVVLARGGGIDVLLGNGDGTLKTPKASGPAKGAASVLLRDIDSDGKLDVVYAGFTGGGMGWMPGKGDGTFGTPITVTTGTSTINALAGDWNGDGKLDLAGTDETAKKIILANADGTLITRLDVAFEPSQLVSGDFDGDGRIDLIAGGSASLLTLFRNNGNGTFTTHDISLPAPFGLMRTADVDGDGDPDLVVTTNESNAPWTSSYINDGKGNFHQVGRTFTLLNLNAAFGDFDRDGRLDFVGQTFEGRHIAFYHGRGDGTFIAAQMLAVNYGTGTNDTHGPYSGDFDGDGNLDLAVSNRSSKDMTIYLGRGDGTFRQPFNISAGGSVTFAADVDGDGRPDIYGVDASTIFIRRNLGNATFAEPLSQPYSGAPVLFADVTGDGIPELIIVDSHRVEVRPGLGAARFGEPVFTPLGEAGDSTTEVTGDFDGDGKRDLLIGESTGHFFFMKSRGDGSFAAPLRENARTIVMLSMITLDINGDGKLDFATNEPLSVQLGNGDGAFREIASPDLTASSLCAGDWNKDGVDDLAVVNNSNSVLLLLGHRDGTITEETEYDAGNAPSNFATGDFNGDGRTDIVIGNGGLGFDTVALLLNDPPPPRLRPARH